MKVAVMSAMFLVLAICPFVAGTLMKNGHHLAAHVLTFMYAAGFGALAAVAASSKFKDEDDEDEKAKDLHR